MNIRFKNIRFKMITVLPLVVSLGMGCALSSAEDWTEDDMTESTEMSIEVTNTLRASLPYARALSLPSFLRPADLQLVDTLVGELRKRDAVSAGATWRALERGCLRDQSDAVRLQVIRYGLRSAFIDSHPTLSQELDHHRFHADQAVALQNQVSYLKDVQRRTAGNVNVRIVRAAPYRRGTENLVQQSDGFLSARQLAEEIAWVESEAEETKRKREEFQEMFENFDQRSEELLNTLAAVLKAMQEMQGSVARNLL